MGSPRFVDATVGELHCLHAWFPVRTTLDSHFHDRATFGVILHGGFDLRFDSAAIRRRTLPCGPGTVFTEPPGEKHENEIGDQATSVLIVQVDPDAAEARLGPVRSMMVDRIVHFRNGRVASCARRLASELNGPDDLSRLAMETLALEMLVTAARRDERWDAGDDVPAWLDRARDYIHANFRRSLRIADVAEAADIHPAHLASVFSRTYDVPVATYIRRLRLDWSLERLATSDEPIGSIALAAGFADQPHFTRTVKKYTGSTPGEYRRRAS